MSNDNDNIINNIWAILDNENENSKLNITNENYCNNCNIIVNEIDNTCRECGLINKNDVQYSDYLYEEQPEFKKSKPNTQYSSRMQKMQEWLMWTNEEKNTYKLNIYTRELCDKLAINKYLIDRICSFVLQVMTAIKNSCDGPKRSRVKDGIIIVCIYYISKNEYEYKYSYIELSKKLGLNLKYVSKADKLIMELINTNKLNISKEFVNNFLKITAPIDYVTKIIDKYQLNEINQQLINMVSELIDICEDNDILLDHTPLSIGVSCFYYILQLNNMDTDVKMFSDIYDLSIVTISKTFNKLKVYSKNFEKMGITKIL
jgi:hypothetical protein